MNGIKNISLHKKNNVTAKLLLGGAALLFFLVALNFFSAGVKNVFYGLSSPIEKVFWAAGESSSGYLSSIFKFRFLDNENENLKVENQKLLSEVASLRALLDASRAQGDVEFAYQNSGFKLMMAGVTGLDGQDMISINKGSEDGILAGMPVINQHNVLYGKVFEVYKNYSKVMLISNTNSALNVKVQKSQEIQPSREINGLVKGKGGLKVFLDLVLIDETINENDVLVTSSLEGVFPKDLLVGRIQKVEKNDQNPHQQAQVQAFLNISQDNLFVITNYKR